MQRLDALLEMPLTHHEAKRRASHRPILADVLAEAADGRTIAELDEVFKRAGGDYRSGRATLAWLLKYGLLTRPEKNSDPDSAVSLNRGGAG